jgi:integrase
VLSLYSDDVLSGKLSEAHVLYDIAKLTKWWGTKCVSEINSQTTKEYFASRKGVVPARRELSFLNAAVRYWHVERGPLKFLPIIKLPPKPAARTHWITREQAAAFLWQARKWPHLRRFFIIGWYTGSRRSVIAGLRWSMVDLKTGIMLRKPPGSQLARNKQAPPVRMGRRLMSHMKRWKRLDGKGAENVIHFKGKPIKRPLRTWEMARKAAKLPTYVTPHILRHTRATNLMKAGVQSWEAAKALGMTVAVLESTYGHHHPSWQKGAAEVE